MLIHFSVQSMYVAPTLLNNLKLDILIIKNNNQDEYLAAVQLLWRFINKEVTKIEGLLI